ncbi:MAG: outer membrane beta-barrel protein [Vicinamibacterales bacterium]
MRLVRQTTWLLMAAAIALPARPAQAQQALNFSLGYFAVNGEDARADGDVLVANREILAFDIRDFDSGSIGLEWLLPVGEFLEFGAGAGFTSRSVPSVYDALVNRDGGEIEQDLKLRVAPFSATVRLLPFGRSRAVQPYVGGGIGLFAYRYSEVGDFVDFTDRSIFRDQFVATGTETGGIALAGIRVPLGDTWSLGGEVRWQKATADLSDEFLGTTLDLGGFHYLATIHVKF